jgi:hypothetical protein
MVIIEEKRMPNQENSTIYEKFFTIYSELYRSIKEKKLYEKLSEII